MVSPSLDLSALGHGAHLLFGTAKRIASLYLLRGCFFLRGHTRANRGGCLLVVCSTPR